MLRNIIVMKKMNRFYVVSFVLLLISGCYTYSPIPDAVNSSTYTGLNESQQKILPVDCKVLTLDIAAQVAVANNPDYLSMSHSVNAAWSRFYTSLNSYFPVITADYGITENRYTPQNSGGNGTDSQANVVKGGALNANWVIFDGLVREMNMLAKKHSANQEEFLDKDARRLLVQSVANSYNNVLLARENIRIAEADESFNQKLYDETELKYKVGEVSLSEPLNFKVKVNQAKNGLIVAQFNFITAKYVLASLLGLTEGDIPSHVDFPPMSSRKYDFAADVSVYLDTALNNRPDLQAYREALLAADYTVWSKWGQFLPVISANGSWGYQREDTGNGMWRNYGSRTQDRSFNYGITAEWVLFNGGKRYFELQESQAQLAESQLSVVAKWITVVTEVRQAYENYRQAVDQVALFEETLTLVQKTRDLVEEEYKAGNAPLTRVNESQKDLVNAESNLVNSKINLENAKAQVDAATGAN